MTKLENSDLQTLLLEVDALRTRTSALERQLADQRRARRRSLSLLLGTGLVVLLAGGVATAADGNCPNGLPACFAANAPAIAANVNFNFSQLKEWLEQKVGPVGTPNLTVSGTVAVTNAVRIQTGTTSSATAASGRPLFVTGNIQDGQGATGGIEFRHDNLTQGIGFGYNTIYATGSLADQTLFLRARGSAPVTVLADLSTPFNAWGSNTQLGEKNFFLNTPGQLTWSECATGQYVCGVGTGHVSGDNNYWTGARFAIRCCSL